MRDLLDLSRRAPRGRGRAWARLVYTVGPRAVEWRVFRRDSRGVTHMERVVLPAITSRAEAARQVRHARALLVWRVDRIDFDLLGLTDTTPRPELAHA